MANAFCVLVATYRVWFSTYFQTPPRKRSKVRYRMFKPNIRGVSHEYHQSPLAIYSTRKSQHPSRCQFGTIENSEVGCQSHSERISRWQTHRQTPSRPSRSLPLLIFWLLVVGTTMYGHMILEIIYHWNLMECRVVGSYLPSWKWREANSGHGHVCTPSACIERMLERGTHTLH